MICIDKESYALHHPVTDSSLRSPEGIIFLFLSRFNIGTTFLFFFFPRVSTPDLHVTLTITLTISRALALALRITRRRIATNCSTLQ